MKQNCFDGVEMIGVSKDKNIFGFLNKKILFYKGPA